ncbi:MAG TPA: hypothetical protein PK995_02520 [Bacteroidia bacterium]|nr:hypothetical protein [Bacteroidia bacterium]
MSFLYFLPIIGFLVLIIVSILIVFYLSSDSIRISPFSIKTRTVKEGDRLAIYGGYDKKPKYLNNNQYYTGKVIKLITFPNDEYPHIVLKMDKKIVYDNNVGEYFVLVKSIRGDYRYERFKVSIFLFDKEPDFNDVISRKGIWIESRAIYDFEKKINLFKKLFLLKRKLMKDIKKNSGFFIYMYEKKINNFN